MTTAEWQAKYEKDGRVDLWLEEEFNSGSRLVVSHPPPPFTLLPLGPSTGRPCTAALQCPHAWRGSTTLMGAWEGTG